MLKKKLCWIALGCIVGGMGCSGSESGDGPSGPSSYVIGAGIFSPQGITSYAGVTDSLAADAELSIGEAIEVPGLSLLYVRTGSGEFFIDSISELIMRKYRVVEGEITQEGRLSFANLGFSSTSRLSQNVFVSATESYLVDSSTLQLVRWNPETMEILDSEELEGIARDDGNALVYTPVIRDGEAFFPFAYSNPGDDFIRPEAVMLVLNLADGSSRVISDSTCGDGIYSMLAENGDIYLASGTANASLEYLNREGVGASCIRRIRAGADDFDPDYHPTFGELTGGEVGGGMAPGVDGSVYFRNLEPDLLTGDPATSSELLAQAAWGFLKLDLASEAVSATEFTPSAGRFTVVFAGDRAFVSESEANFASSRLVETTVDPPLTGIEVTGIAAALGEL
ncbi:MAG: hypothetical protein AAF500_16535 [Myxococcota bacterium]